MKRFLVIALVLGCALTVYAAKDWKRIRSDKTITVTSSVTADSTRKPDTLWMSPGQELYGYRGYVLKVKVHAKPILSSTAHGNGMGNADTVRIMVKRRDGLRAPMLIDSTLFAIRALNTVACSTLVQFHPNDSLWMEDIFAYVMIADTMSDTAGVTMAVKVTGDLLVKE